jgi:hypothetical protein
MQPPSFSEINYVSAPLDIEEVERRFEAVFESSEDRSRLFEKYQPQEVYEKLAMLTYIRQKHIMFNIQKTHDEIQALRGSISILEMQNDQIREHEFQSALRGIDITTGGQSYELSVSDQ